MVPMKPGNAGGGTGPRFGGASKGRNGLGIGASLEAPPKVRELQEKLYVKAKKEPNYRFYLLYDKVYRRDILTYAYKVARQNKGTAGVDGETFESIDAKGLEKWLDGLQEELHKKTYRPSPVRRVMIPKPDGGERPLGIPTIRDRVVQTAAKVVLEPIFEADFEENAYGYRPERGAWDAIREVHRALCNGYTDVVDADLSKYFDTIPHDELMRSVERRIADRQMLKLIRGWLKVPVEERDEKGDRRMTGGKKSRMGTPQGGVISPLLANVYMNRFLKHWRQRQMGVRTRARLVNYADDFVILSRGKAEEARDWTRQVMNRIGLTLNETKTCIRDGSKETFVFLGYAFGPAHYRQRSQHWIYMAAKPAKKSIARIKAAVRAQLQRGNTEPWEDVVKKLNQRLEGWANYFSYGTTTPAYRAVNWYVYNRVRWFLKRRHKVRTRGTHRFPWEQVFGEYGVLHLTKKRHAMSPPIVGRT